MVTTKKASERRQMSADEQRLLCVAQKSSRFKNAGTLKPKASLNDCPSLAYRFLNFQIERTANTDDRCVATSTHEDKSIGVDCIVSKQNEYGGCESGYTEADVLAQGLLVAAIRFDLFHSEDRRQVLSK